MPSDDRQPTRDDSSAAPIPSKEAKRLVKIANLKEQLAVMDRLRRRDDQGLSTPLIAALRWLDDIQARIQKARG